MAATNKYMINETKIMAVGAFPIIFAALLLSAPISLYAQDKQEEVTIIAPYNPSVTTASKINRNPKIEQADEERLPEITYEPKAIKLNTSVSPEFPSPARVPGDPEKDLFRNHLRAGFGNYVTPYFELWVNSLQSDEFKAGAHLRHLSSFGQIKDYGKSSFSSSMIEAYAAKFLNGHTLSGKVDYSHKLVHQYGYMPDDFPALDISGEDIRQVYHNFGFQAGIRSSNDADDAFNYRLAIDGYHMFDRYSSRETRFLVQPGISKKADLFNNNRSQQIGLDLDVDYFINNDSISDYSGGIISFTPYVNFDLKPYRIYVGLQGAYKMDSASKFYIYPAIRAEVGLLENTVIIYAGVDGGISRVSYKRLTDENPFLNSILPLDYQNDKIHFYGGVKGRIAGMFDYQAGIGYRSVDMLPLFVSDTANILGNTFTVVYDKAGVFSAEGQLGFRSRDDFGLIFRAGYHSYAMDNEEKAWHRPALELDLETYYIIREKLTLSASMSSMQGTYAPNYDNGQVTARALSGWFDLGLGAEYRINSQFSAFLNINNLLNQGYFRWDGYPVYKLNAMAGVGFSF